MVISLAIATVILLLLGVFLGSIIVERKNIQRSFHYSQALYVAEAGIEKTLCYLKQHLQDGGVWTDSMINGETVVDDPDEDGWRSFINSSLGSGSYSVELRPVSAYQIWVKSTGNVDDVSRSIQVFVEAQNLSPWNNSIYAGRGSAAGTVISGNARIHGSVHILGDELESDDVAISFTGTAGIWNNYEGMPAELATKIPPCPTTTFNGETVESLGAVVRVKRGKVALSGTGTVGQEDVPGNSFKETVDAVYITDGYGGNKGAANVYSDNGTGNTYDLGDLLEFPSLTDPYIDPDTGVEYPTYLEYLSDNSVHISINEISSKVDSFSYPDGTNSISWDPNTGVLNIEGIVFVDTDSLDIGEKDETIEYTGNGSIVVARISDSTVAGEIRVHGNLLAQGTYPAGGFPTNSLGLITGDLYLATGESQRLMTGVFFAENQIISEKQTEIAGTFVSNYFDLGSQVPRIYQVPELATNLPPGMVASSPVWDLVITQWNESTS